MFDLLEKIQTKEDVKFTDTSSIKSKPTTEKTKSIRKSVKSVKSKSSFRNTEIIRDKFEDILGKLKQSIETKLEKANAQLNQIILEANESSKSESEDSASNWKEPINQRKLESSEQLGLTSRVAEKKHTMVKRKPNELTDEDLSS